MLILPVSRQPFLGRSTITSSHSGLSGHSQAQSRRLSAVAYAASGHIRPGTVQPGRQERAEPRPAGPRFGFRFIPEKSYLQFRFRSRPNSLGWLPLEYLVTFGERDPGLLAARPDVPCRSQPRCVVEAAGTHTDHAAARLAVHPARTIRAYEPSVEPTAISGRVEALAVDRT